MKGKVIIIEKGIKYEFGRRCLDSSMASVGLDMQNINLDTLTGLSLFAGLGCTTVVDEGIRYFYEFDIDKSTLKVNGRKYGTDEPDPGNVLFNGTIRDFYIRKGIIY